MKPQREFIKPPDADDTFVRAVWRTPQNYNRASRRAAKLWGRIWKRANTFPADLPTRYTRRHFTTEALLKPTSRRQRRHRARIMRDARLRGLTR